MVSGIHRMLNELFQQLLELRSEYNSESPKRLEAAFEMGAKAHEEQKRAGGEPYFSHPIEVAIILTECQSDDDTLIAALLHDVIEDTSVKASAIKKAFGKTVLSIVQGVTIVESKLHHFESETITAKEAQDLETIRNILKAARTEPRVLLVKIADRLHNMETLESIRTVKKRVKKAEETLSIYVPIAARMGHLHWARELEKYSFKYLKPEAFKTISAFLGETNEKRISIYERFHHRVSQKLNNKISVRWNINYHYSWENLTNVLEANKKLILDDVLSLDLIVKDQRHCYEVLGAVHQIGSPYGAEKDYIARPKSNGYRGYYTSLITAENHKIMVRILTEDMLLGNEHGWAYFNFISQEKFQPSSQLVFLRDLPAINSSTQNQSENFIDQVQKEILSERMIVYVDDEKTLVPEGATVLDAVFLQKKSQALKTESVSLKGETLPLRTKVKPEMRLDTKLANTSQAAWDWMDLTSTAHSKVILRKALEGGSSAEKIAYGRQLLQRDWDLYQYGEFSDFNARQWQRIELKLGFTDRDELLSSIASGLVSPFNVFQAILPEKQSWNPFKPSFWQDPRTSHMTTARFSLEGEYRKNSEVVAQVHEAKAKNQIIFTTGLLNEKPDENIFEWTIDVKAPRKKNLHNFMESINKIPRIKHVDILMSKVQENKTWTLGALVAITWILLEPVLTWFQQHHLFDNLLLKNVFLILLLLPLIWFNFFFSQTLRNYSSRLRRSKKLIVFSVLINFLAVGVFTYAIFDLELINASWLIPMMFFVISLLPIAYNVENLTIKDNRLGRESSDWKQIQKDKIIGYSARLVAVILFGVTPVVVKYFFSSEKASIVITSLSFLVAAIILAPFIIYHLKNRSWDTKSGLNKTFLFIVITHAFFFTFYFLSVQFINASSASFFLNLAPMLGLIFAMLFWRKSIDYLKNKNDLIKISIAFMIGLVGATFLIFNGQGIRGTSYLYIGEFLATLTLLADVAMTIGIIQYVKLKNSFSGLAFISHLMVALAILFLPISIYGLINYEFSINEIIGIFIIGGGNHVIALWLAYIAFQKTDGLINYLMLNLAPLAALFVEVVFFGYSLTYAIIIGGFLIIVSTSLAEYVNTQSQKRSLKSSL